MKNPFLNALPIIINALSNTLGVKVMLNAGDPRTNGKVVYLPAIDANDRKSCIKALGFSVHEGGGHCRFTDFSVLEGILPLEKAVWNCLEDIRVEKAISEVYPGARMYLSDTVDLLVEDEFFVKPQDAGSPAELMQLYMLYQLRLKVLGQAGITPYAEAAATCVAEALPLGMRVRLEALMYEVENCTNSQDVLDLSRAIIKMMEEEAKKEEEKENQPQNPEQGDAGDQPDPSSQNQQGDGQPQGQTQKEDGTSEEESGDGSNNAVTQPGNEAVNGTQDDNAPKASDIIKQILSAGDGDVLKGVGEMLAESLAQNTATGKEAGSAVPHRNVPYQAVKVSNVTYIDDARNRVAGATNALRVRAQSLLQAQTLSVKRSVYAGTKLNPKNLHQAPLGGPVFIKERKGTAVDTAILILADRSVSMEDYDRIDLALDAALATSMAFNRPDVKTAVFAFPYGKDNAVLKGWNEQPAAAIHAYRQIGTDGSTPMAEAMMGAGIALFQRPEKRKILMVTTDGQPDNSDQARWVIDLARRSGIEVLGLGIQLDAAPVFGQEWSASVQTIDQLPSAMIGMLDKVMLKKAA